MGRKAGAAGEVNVENVAIGVEMAGAGTVDASLPHPTNKIAAATTTTRAGLTITERHLLTYGPTIQVPTLAWLVRADSGMGGI